jgi:hypothetical protein
MRLSAPWFLLVLLVLPMPAAAQASPSEMDALRAAARADKRGHVASTLALTDAEAKRLWPAYDAYQRELDRANRRVSVALVEAAGRAGPVTDAYARNLGKELAAADDAEVRARRLLRDRALKALPARKAVAYLQLEWRLRAAQHYDLASGIPQLRP